MFMCPGCNEPHAVRVAGPGAWGFNCNNDAPTFTPSVLVTGMQTVRNADGSWAGEWVKDADGKCVPMRCHSYVTDGQIQFLTDCTHALAGQTVPLPDWKYNA